MSIEYDPKMRFIRKMTQSFMKISPIFGQAISGPEGFARSKRLKDIENFTVINSDLYVLALNLRERDFPEFFSPESEVWKKCLSVLGVEDSTTLRECIITYVDMIKSS